MVLYFVIPCYYDADVLPVTGPVFLNKLHALIARGAISEKSRVVFINDGSGDQTWAQITRMHASDSHCVGLDLAQNVGEQEASLAGLFYANAFADCCITMDSDLQDDIDAVDQMLQAFEQGSEIVFGVRKSRKKDAPLEKATSKLFYAVMKIVEPHSIPNHSGFRLMSKRAVEALQPFLNASFFLSALTASLNLSFSIVYYDRVPRAAGSSGYNFKKRLHLGIEAVLAHLALRLRRPRSKKTPTAQIQQVLD